MTGITNKPAWLIALITLIYFTAGLIGAVHHEVWLDEAHHFLLARDSTSIADLGHNARYEGHPLLWNVLLFIITRFTHDVFYMQLLNVTIMSAVCYLFVKHSRVSVMLCLLLLLSYFFIYEFLLISRNYSLLLLALTCTFISLEKKKTKALYLSLFFLSFTHGFGIIIACTLCAILFVYRDYMKTNKTILAILILHNLTVLWNIRVPPDHFLFGYNTDGLFSITRLSKGAAMFVKGLIPIPAMPVRWNSNLLISTLKAFGALIGAGIYGLILFSLRKQKFYFWLYLISTMLIVVSMTVSPVTMGTRYCGLLFILFAFIACFTGLPSVDIAVKRLLITLTIIQGVAGLIFFISDMGNDFSNGKNVASFIRQSYPGKIIVASNFSSAPAIAAYLDKKIYYPEPGEFGSYCKWNTWPFVLTSEQFITQVEQQLKVQNSLILVLNQHYYNTSLSSRLSFNDPGTSSKLLKRFDGALVNNENYYVFLVARK